MEIEKTTLTIEGKPEEEIKILYRNRGDEPPPPVWEGKLDANGRVTVDIPAGYLLVFGSSGRDYILRLYETRPATLTIRLGEELREYPPPS